MSLRDLRSELETEIETLIQKGGELGAAFMAQLFHKKAMALDPAAVASSLQPLIGEDAAKEISNAGTGADRGSGDAGKQNPNKKADGSTLVQQSGASKGDAPPPAGAPAAAETKPGSEQVPAQGATAKPMEAPKDPAVS